MATTNRIAFATPNGTAHTSKPSKPAKATRPTKAERDATQHTLILRRPIAYGVGGVGVSLLALSIVHCAQSISLLTSSHWTLSTLMAVAIDGGLVACEMAELVADSASVKRWSLAYVVLAVLLSMGLNAYSFSLHATVAWAGIALGIVIPALVLILGRVYSHLAK